MSQRFKVSVLRRALAASAFGISAFVANFAIASEDALAFHQCTFEANRYIVCRVPPAPVEASLQAADRVHAGAAFGSFVSNDLKRRGCTGHADETTFILNGVFFSVDSKGLEKIDCPDRSAKLKFSEEKVSAFEFFQFFFD